MVLTETLFSTNNTVSLTGDDSFQICDLIDAILSSNNDNLANG
ncbi:MAG: hypothetical protein ACM3VV_02600 [Deltaproteobacteria bacterium]|nr:hypothetical protein [Nitrososphaeraceae archaeon]